MNSPDSMCRWLAAVAAAFVAQGGSAVAQVSFRPLGFFPGGRFESLAYGVSADGSVVVGHSQTQFSRWAARWTSAGMEGVGPFPTQFASTAHAVTADGVYAVGDVSNLSGNRAYRWSEATGMEFITGTPQGFAYGISDDGAVVVGRIRPFPNEGTSFAARSARGFVYRCTRPASPCRSPPLRPRTVEGCVVQRRVDPRKDRRESDSCVAWTRCCRP